MEAIGTSLGHHFVPDESCWVQYLFSRYFIVAALFWCDTIMLECYMMITQGVVIHKSWRPFIMSFCWGWPIVLMLLPLSTETVGVDDYAAQDDGNWCMYYVGTDQENLAWMIVSFYLWTWFSIFLMIFLTCRITLYARTLPRGSLMRPHIKAVVDRLKYYPLMKCIQWTMSTINVLYIYVHSDRTFNLDEYKTNKFFSFSAGIFTSILFFIQNPQVRERWYVLLVSLFHSFQSPISDGVSLKSENDFEGSGTMNPVIGNINNGLDRNERAREVRDNETTVVMTIPAYTIHSDEYAVK